MDVQANLTQLRHFYYFIKNGSFAKAGREVGVEKAAVHQQLRRLQASVGPSCPLWEPAPDGGYQATPRGRKLYEFLAPFFEALPRVMDEVCEPAADELTVVTSPMIAMEYIPAVIEKMARLHPNVRVHLRTQIDNADTLEMLRSYEAQLAVWPLQQEADLIQGVPAADVDVVLAISRKNPLARKRRLRLRDLDGQPFVSLNYPWGHRIDAEQFFDRHGIGVKTVLETTDSTITRQYVLRNLGFTIAYAGSFLRAAKENIRLYRIGNEFPPARLMILQRVNRTLPPTAHDLAELLLEQGRAYAKARAKLRVSELGMP